MKNVNLTTKSISNTQIAELAQQLHSRGLAVPALFLLEMYKPLTGVLAAVGQSFYPLVFPLFGAKHYDMIVALLENRDQLELFLLELEKNLQTN